jgi:hypothetical protein
VSSRFILSAFAVVFMLVQAIIFPPVPRTWRGYAAYTLGLIVVVPALQWWFEREIRIGQEKVRARDGDSRSAR